MGSHQIPLVSVKFLEHIAHVLSQASAWTRAQGQRYPRTMAEPPAKRVLCTVLRTLGKDSNSCTALSLTEPPCRSGVHMSSKDQIPDAQRTQCFFTLYIPVPVKTMHQCLNQNTRCRVFLTEKNDLATRFQMNPVPPMRIQPMQ